MVGSSSTNSESSSGSSKEMADSRENNSDTSGAAKMGKGSGGGGGKKSGGSSKLDVDTVYLASREDNKFPSDTDTESNGSVLVDGKRKRKETRWDKKRITVEVTNGGGQSLELVDLLKSGIGKGGGKRGVGAASGGSSNNGSLSSTSGVEQRFSRALQVVEPDLSFRGAPQPVTLPGFKNTTVTRINNPKSAASSPVESPAVGEGRKRRPRMETTLRLSQNFILDILSKKNRDWAWPLYKHDKVQGPNNSFEEPLYLLDIKNKFNDRKYNNLDEFTVDMKKLIIYFQINYPSDHQFHISAKQLGDMFDEEYGKITETTRKSARGRPSKTSVAATSGNAFSNHVVHAAEIKPRREREVVPASINFSSPMDVQHKSALPYATFGSGVTDAGFENLSLVGGPLYSNLLRNPLVNGTAGIDFAAANVLMQASLVDGRVGPLPQRNQEGRASESEGSSRPPSQEQVGASQPLSLSDTWSDVFSKGDDKEGETAYSPTTGKRKCNGANGGDLGKKLRTDPGAVDCNISLVKEERILEERDREDRRLFGQQFLHPPAASSHIKCKWIMDGISGIANQEAVMREIKNLVRADDPELVVDLEFLETLEDHELAAVGEIVCRYLFEYPRPPNQQLQQVGPVQVLSAELKTAIGLINFAVADSDRTGRELRILQDLMFGLLARINALHYQNLLDLNKWNERKMLLMGCAVPPPPPSSSQGQR